jgi:hypothetical protein
MIAALIRTVSLLALPVLAAAQEGINWLDNYQQALAEGKKTGKPIFLEFRCEA